MIDQSKTVSGTSNNAPDNKVDVVTGKNCPCPSYKTTTGGWITTAWTQTDPYNKHCPTDGSGTRCLAGDLAVAIAQIVHYRSIICQSLDFTPFSQTGNSYTSTQAGLKIKIFDDAAKYQFPDVSTLNTQLHDLKLQYKHGKGPDIPADSLAYLVFACGVALHQNYGSDHTTVGLSNIEYPLSEQLCFKGNITKNYYPNQHFFRSIDSNLTNHHPVIFELQSIASSTQRSYAICDGYVQATINPLTVYTGYHLNYNQGKNSPKQIAQCYWYNGDPMPDSNYKLNAAYLNLFKKKCKKK